MKLSFYILVLVIKFLGIYRLLTFSRVVHCLAFPLVCLTMWFCKDHLTGGKYCCWRENGKIRARMKFKNISFYQCNIANNMGEMDRKEELKNMCAIGLTAVISVSVSLLHYLM